MVGRPKSGETEPLRFLGKAGDVLEGEAELWLDLDAKTCHRLVSFRSENRDEKSSRGCEGPRSDAIRSRPLVHGDAWLARRGRHQSRIAGDRRSGAMAVDRKARARFLLFHPAEREQAK